MVDPAQPGCIGHKLLELEPDWHRILYCLQLATRGPRCGQMTLSGHRRRGLGVSGPGADQTQQQREVATLQCWHRCIVKDAELHELTDADPALPPPSSTVAARAFPRLPSVGPYSVKSMLALLTLTDRIRFEAGVTPPGLFFSAVRVDWGPQANQAGAVAMEHRPPRRTSSHRSTCTVGRV